MSREEVYKEIKEMFGNVPLMFKEIPDSTLELEWTLFKKIQFDKGPVPNKYRELIRLAVSSVTKCKHCVFFHTELAKLHGATKEEIENAVNFAKSSAGWSAYLSGMQVDFDTFKKDVKQAVAHAKKKRNKK